MNNQLIELSELEKRLKKFDKMRDWEKFHYAKDLAISICCEAAELLEIFQWLSDEEIEKLKRDHAFQDKVGYELADIIMYSVRLTQKIGINLNHYLLEKIDIIESRYPAEKVKGHHCKSMI